jgi:hypothetical protein
MLTQNVKILVMVSFLKYKFLHFSVYKGGV